MWWRLSRNGRRESESAWGSIRQFGGGNQHEFPGLRSERERPGHPSLVSLGLFYSTVRNGSPMDYKQQGWTLTDTGQLGSSPFQDFGNFNYGAVGTAWGIPQDMLLRGAGYAQEQAGTSTPEWGHWDQGPPYGDDPADQQLIMQGIQYYQNNCYNSPNPG